MSGRCPRGNDPNPRVRARIRGQHRDRIVGRTIVDDDDFKVGECLRLRRAHGLDDIAGTIECGGDDSDQWQRLLLYRGTDCGALAEQHFDVRTFLAAYEQVYDELCAWNAKPATAPQSVPR